jgi:NRPS condensation-like uncharacterized protein
MHGVERYLQFKEWVLNIKHLLCHVESFKRMMFLFVHVYEILLTLK